LLPWGDGQAGLDGVPGGRGAGQREDDGNRLLEELPGSVAGAEIDGDDRVGAAGLGGEGGERPGQEGGAVAGDEDGEDGLTRGGRGGEVLVAVWRLVLRRLVLGRWISGAGHENAAVTDPWNLRVSGCGDCGAHPGIDRHDYQGYRIRRLVS